MNVVTKFVKEAIKELGKVTWPTRPTVVRLTIGVVIVSIVFAIFISFVDVWVTRGVRGLISAFQPTATQESPGIEIGTDDIQVETQPVN